MRCRRWWLKKKKKIRCCAVPIKLYACGDALHCSIPKILSSYIQSLVTMGKGGCTWQSGWGKFVRINFNLHILLWQVFSSYVLPHTIVSVGFRALLEEPAVSKQMINAENIYEYLELCGLKEFDLFIQGEFSWHHFEEWNNLEIRTWYRRWIEIELNHIEISHSALISQRPYISKSQWCYVCFLKDLGTRLLNKKKQYLIMLFILFAWPTVESMLHYVQI